MNQNTVAILIAVLGVVAGFITAFFAEPVKIYYQDKARLKYLRVGLYKEMWQNYILCNSIVEDGIRRSKEGFPRDTQTIIDASIGTVKRTLRREYYEQVLKNDLSFFYRLTECSFINSLYADLLSLPKVIEVEVDDDIHRSMFAIEMMAGIYRNNFAVAFYAKILDQVLLIEIMRNDFFDYRKVLEVGKKISDARIKK
jgi:hypothetical protein